MENLINRFFGLGFIALAIMLFVPILLRLMYEWMKYLLSPFHKNEKISFWKILFKKGKMLEVSFYNYIYKLGVKNIILNVVLKNNDKESEIDCIFEYNGSTFVVELKAYTGLITGKYNDKEWISHYGKNKFKFMNPLHQNYSHTKTISEFLNIEHDKLVSLVYFSPHAKLKVKINNVIQYAQLHTFLEKEHPKLIGVVDKLKIYKNMEKSNVVIKKQEKSIKGV